jgi:hypothetical protein
MCSVGDSFGVELEGGMEPHLYLKDVKCIE